MSGLDCFHEWIGVRNRKRKLTVRGSELGASLLSVWIVLLELGVWIGASQALCVCERAEWKIFEVKMRTELIFRLFCLILRSNWKYFQFDPIYRTYQTCYFLENDFWISFEVKTNGHLFYDQTENIFSLTQFTGPTKHIIFRKMVSEFHLKSKQTDPRSPRRRHHPLNWQPNH